MIIRSLNARDSLRSCPKSAPHAAPSTLAQLLRFGVVGVAVNLLLYTAYLALVNAQLGAKTAMSVTYAAGVVLSYRLNRRWSFGRSAGPRSDMVRYAALYSAGYLLNLGALRLFVDEMGLRHQLVQAVMVFVVAVLTFGLQKVWVFRAPRSSVQPLVGQPDR